MDHNALVGHLVYIASHPWQALAFLKICFFPSHHYLRMLLLVPV